MALLSSIWLSADFYEYFQACRTSGDAKDPGPQPEHREQHPDAVHLRKHHPLSLLIFRRQGEVLKNVIRM